jgi:hypothetical protein
MLLPDMTASPMVQHECPRPVMAHALMRPCCHCSTAQRATMVFRDVLQSQLNMFRRGEAVLCSCNVCTPRPR